MYNILINGSRAYGSRVPMQPTAGTDQRQEISLKIIGFKLSQRERKHLSFCT
jgi:hypothetical protein